MSVGDAKLLDRSQPGTGSPPSVTSSMDDKAIVNGWRRDSPPAAFDPQGEVLDWVINTTEEVRP